MLEKISCYEEFYRCPHLSLSIIGQTEISTRLSKDIANILAL